MALTPKPQFPRLRARGEEISYGLGFGLGVRHRGDGQTQQGPDSGALVSGPRWASLLHYFDRNLDCGRLLRLDGELVRPVLAYREEGKGY